MFTVGTWSLGCFHSNISTQTFWRAVTLSVDSCTEIKRVWRKVPESDARGSVRLTGRQDKAKDITPSSVWRREAWKEEALDDLPSKDERERAIINQTNLGTF